MGIASEEYRERITTRKVLDKLEELWRRVLFEGHDLETVKKDVHEQLKFLDERRTNHGGWLAD
jgi:hypothetical protein